MYLLRLVVNLLQVYVYIVIIRAIVSWFSPSPYNQIWRILVDITEPPLRIIRNILRQYIPSLGYIDISPIILILLINFVIYMIAILAGGLSF